MCQRPNLALPQGIRTSPSTTIVTRVLACRSRCTRAPRAPPWTIATQPVGSLFAGRGQSTEAQVIRPLPAAASTSLATSPIQFVCGDPRPMAWRRRLISMALQSISSRHITQRSGTPVRCIHHSLGSLRMTRRCRSSCESTGFCAKSFLTSV